jgi:DNA polymerase III gamma/tau subunit
LIAIAADGSFRDALGVTQKVIMASGDAIGSADEVAAIIGAPKTATMLQLIVSALQFKDRVSALSAVAVAVASGIDMKLFARLLLEHVRAVMLLP